MKPRSRIHARRRWFRRVMDEDLRRYGLWECRPVSQRAETNPRITALVDVGRTETMPTETSFSQIGKLVPKTLDISKYLWHN